MRIIMTSEQFSHDNRRILLCSAYSVVEPLGLLHLAGIARQEGWEPKIAMVRGNNFASLDDIARDYKPDLLGFSIYTGNHVQVFNYLDTFRMKNNIPVVVGGPHPTYFPNESTRHADWVVLSEGFRGLRKILRGEAQKGIVPLFRQEKFPVPDREGFYRDYPEHKKNPIKSVITQVGCPYSCTYCYNSSTLTAIEPELSKNDLQIMKTSLGRRLKLFPKSNRSIDEVIREIEEVVRVSPETKVIYFQDDVFGIDNEWIKQFKDKFRKYGLTFHAQLRFERADPEKTNGRERLELMREAGCTGITYAVECANSMIREEVLNRSMRNEVIFRTLAHMKQLGMRCRIEQMIGLPYGATTKETPVNLAADLETLKLNVQLREQTGLPTVAWASIFSPYHGTVLGKYCTEHGFYRGDYSDIPINFFGRSAMRFPRQWIGPKLNKEEQGFWLSEEENEKYKDQMKLLREIFQLSARLPAGHKFAKKFIEEGKFKDGCGAIEALSNDLRAHAYDYELYGVGI